MKIIDIIYPKKCIICKKSGANICESCKNYAQRHKAQHSDKAFYGFLYRDELRRAMLNYKFNGKKSYIYGLTELFLETINQETLEEFDFITYVPISFGRMHERGFNQAKLICDEICKVKNRKSVKLFRKRKSKKQSTLSANERKTNVSDKFVLLKDVKNKNVLVIDDIETTGSTAKEIEKTLKNAGAKTVKMCILLKNKK